jgi:alpha/beta superfamily hydrolase
MTAAVLLHPHPDRGGDQYNNVITALYERLPAAGLTPHRFDFSSSELDIARAQAIDAIERAGEPVYLVGYSFGGAVAATVDHPAVVAWGLVAPALTLFTPTIGPDARPKLVIAAENDGWFDPAVLAEATADWGAAESVTVTGTDHFFGGDAARRAAEVVASWIERRV